MVDCGYIRQQYGYEMQIDNFVYKCFLYLGIKETKHQVHYRKRKIKDTYPNLIFTTLGHRRSSQTGDRYQYINGLEDVKELLKGHAEPVVLHTDQGDVYASKAYNDLIKDSVIVRSMSRAGKPTDNPVNESINGWMKEELSMDFKNRRMQTQRGVHCSPGALCWIFYNKRRPCYAIGYDTPVNYQAILQGEIERKNTFEGRSLTEEQSLLQSGANRPM